jgi:hypothetical protein
VPFAQNRYTRAPRDGWKGQQAGFVEKRIQPALELLGTVCRARPDDAGAVARGQVARHELLDRDLAQQRMIEREVDDPEAADAERPKDLEFVETRSCGQQMRVVEPGRRRECRRCHVRHGGR